MQITSTIIPNSVEILQNYLVKKLYKGCSSETQTHAATMPIVDGAATWWQECRAGS
jgi:hypothetical protein